MLNLLPHPEDFHFAQKCLEGNLDALAFFRRTYAAPLLAFLHASGASTIEAREVADDLWADCVTPGRTATPRLARYDGTCQLQTWLNTVALNNLLTRKRREKRWSLLVESNGGDLDDMSRTSPAEAHSEPLEAEAPLLEIMREAIQTAFMQCPAADFVLLHLAYVDELKVTELALIFGCHAGTISRRIQRAEMSLGEATLAQVKRRDPWLELRWSDFVKVCRFARPACFGLD